MITAEQIRDAMIAADITYVSHHECGCCGSMVSYTRIDKQLFFNPGCDCSWTPPQPREWQDAAEWINMQSTQEVKDELAALFGFTVKPT